MGGELHEISAAIGSLQAQTQEHQRQTELLFQKVYEISEKLSVIPVLKITLDEVEPLVRGLETDRIQRNAKMGIISGAAGIASTVVVEGVLHLAKRFGWL